MIDLSRRIHPKAHKDQSDTAQTQNYGHRQLYIHPPFHTALLSSGQSAVRPDLAGYKKKSESLPDAFPVPATGCRHPDPDNSRVSGSRLNFFILFLFFHFSHISRSIVRSKKKRKKMNKKQTCNPCIFPGNFCTFCILSGKIPDFRSFYSSADAGIADEKPVVRRTAPGEMSGDVEPETTGVTGCPGIRISYRPEQETNRQPFFSDSFRGKTTRLP